MFVRQTAEREKGKEEENIERARVKLSFVGTNTPRDRINAITRLNAAQDN